MKTIEQAKLDKFENCTFKELQTYMEENKLRGWHLIKEQNVAKRRLLEFFELSPAIGPAKANVKRSGEGVTPTINLKGMYGWGGKTIRMTLSRPQDCILGGSILLTVNDIHEYPIPYDQAVDVPYPLYEKIKGMKTCRTRVEKLVDHLGERTGEAVTTWEFLPVHNITEANEVPETKDLPCSGQEWYQRKGPEWLANLSMSDMQKVAIYLEISLVDKASDKKSLDTLRDDVMLFVYGYTDPVSIEEAREAIAA